MNDLIIYAKEIHRLIYTLYDLPNHKWTDRAEKLVDRWIISKGMKKYATSYKLGVDADGKPYIEIGYVLPKNIYCVIHEGTIGSLMSIRIY